MVTKFGIHPVTLRQLQYAVAIAEVKSFRRAADLCGVSQPSLSAQIGELESALQVILFERDRRRVLLTPAGADLVERARRVLHETEGLREAALRYLDPLAGILRVGVIPTIGPYLLPALDPALRKEFPRLTLHWREDKTGALVEQVRSGELDAALVALESDLHDLEHAVVGRDHFVLAAAKGHELGRAQRRVPLETLRDRSVLLLEDGHCFRDQALDLCAATGAEELGFRATSMGTLAQMVSAGTGITLLPRCAVEVENRADLLAIREFSRPVPHRTVVLAWRGGSPVVDALQAIAKVAASTFTAHDKAEPRSRSTIRANPPGKKKPN